jgi:hypothetical protein
VEALSAQPINHATLSELQLWTERLGANPYRDCLGNEATKFWAAQTLVTTVMRGSALDKDAVYPASIKRALERGADGLFEVGRPHFALLAETVRKIFAWATRKNIGKLVAVESPLGNSVPCQLLGELGNRLGLEVEIRSWNSPRNDRRSRGRTVEESAAEFCTGLADDSIIVFLDDAITGSRFIKLFDALAIHIDRNRLLAIALVFGSTQDSSRERLFQRLREHESKIDFANSAILFPPHSKFRIDHGAPVYWESPVIWGESDLIAGKRKVNLIFVLIDHVFRVLDDLASTDSEFANDLERAWSLDISGQSYVIAPGLFRSTFSTLTSKLHLDDVYASLHNKARQEFPQDYSGQVSSLSAEDVRSRWLWIREEFLELAESLIGNKEAWLLWRAFDDTFASTVHTHRPRPSRDHDATPYTLPFNSTISALNRRLVDHLTEIALSSH